MVKIIPELRIPLESYLRNESPLLEMRNQLYLNLQTIFQESAEPERELLSALLSGIYEVEDGVMPEPTFRQALQEFLSQQTPIPAAPAAVAD